MKRKVLFALILFAACTGWAQKLEYKVTSLGMKVADLSLNITDKRLQIKVSNSGQRSLFPHINNRYCIDWKEDFLPQRYIRQIHQDALRDSICTIYEDTQATMLQKKKAEKSSYPIPPNCRDIFSLLLKICQSPKPVGEYHVDGNGRIWKVVVAGGKSERINTALGKFQATRYELSFMPLSPQKAPYTDMLTFNMLSEDLKLQLWVNQGGIPIKAQLKKKLLTMAWEIISIS